MNRTEAARAERYRKGKAAEAEVMRRIELALDRLNVAQQSEGGNPAQFLHAVHYLQRGWADDSRSVPAEAPDVHLTHDYAEEIALRLNSMLTWTKNARSTFGESE